MVAKPKYDYDLPAELKLTDEAYKRVIAASAESRKATPELKALIARGKTILKGR